MISGNLGRGIEIRGYLVSGSGGDTILGNLIGTDITGMSVTQDRNPSLLLGNLGDGIFLLNVQNTTGGTAINGNVISGNRGDGLHAVGSSNLTVTGNRIGTSRTGATNMGNNEGVVVTGTGINTIGPGN